MKIRKFNLVDISDDLEDHGNILDITYVDNKVPSIAFPLIQWSQKEFTSIPDRCQSNLTNTNVWLTNKGIQLKPFSSGFKDDTAGLVGKRPVRN